MGWRAITDTIATTARDTFGESVTFTPQSGQPYSLRGIFEDPSLKRPGRGDRSSHADFVNMSPSVDVRSADLKSEPTSGDTVEIRGISFRIVDKQCDGWAITRLILAEA